jgi:hypothetical protein
MVAYQGRPDHQWKERAGVRADAVLRHPPRAGCGHAVERRPVQLRIFGAGRIAITTKGAPVVLQVDQPTYADPQAAVCWSTSLQTGFHRADQFGLGTLIGRSTGEALTMSFSGQGFVVVQPSKEVADSLVSGTGGGQQAGQRRFGRGPDSRQLPGPLTHTARHARCIPGGEVKQISAWSTEAPCGPS